MNQKGIKITKLTDIATRRNGWRRRGWGGVCACVGRGGGTGGRGVVRMDCNLKEREYGSLVQCRLYMIGFMTDHLISVMD